MKKDFGPAEYVVGAALVTVGAMFVAAVVGTIFRWLMWAWQL